MEKMKILLLVFANILILGGFSIYTKAGDNLMLGPNKQEYQGTASMVIRYYDYNPSTGKDVFVEEKKYISKVLVFINPPLKTGGMSESNPFNLQINPDRTVQQDEEGHFDIVSSQIMTLYSGELLLQYWNFTLVGGHFNGILQDNHIQEAATANLLWARNDMAGISMTMPLPMANGTIMTGNVNANAVSITITGQSTDTYRKFVCQISAVHK